MEKHLDSGKSNPLLNSWMENASFDPFLSARNSLMAITASFKKFKGVLRWPKGSLENAPSYSAFSNNLISLGRGGSFSKRAGTMGIFGRSDERNDMSPRRGVALLKVEWMVSSSILPYVIRADGCAETGAVSRGVLCKSGVDGKDESKDSL